MNRVLTDNFMDMPALDPDSPTPLWEQLANKMREEIASGRISGRVPSAAALATAYGVSRDTALHALAQLRAEGLTVSRHGRGTFTVRREE